MDAQERAGDQRAWSTLCVEHPVKLSFLLVCGVISDVLEVESPLPGEGALLASNFTPVSEMTVCAVVFDVTRPMSRDGDSTALALWGNVVIVKLGARDETATEVAGHISPPPE